MASLALAKSLEEELSETKEKRASEKMVLLVEKSVKELTDQSSLKRMSQFVDREVVDDFLRLILFNVLKFFCYFRRKRNRK